MHALYARLLAPAALACACIPGGAALGQARSSVALAARVPIVCDAQADPGGPGVLREFCNSGQGYDVFLDHAPLGEGASAIVDGERIALRGAGPTRISSAAAAGVRTRAFTAEVPAGAELRIRVVPR